MKRRVITLTLADVSEVRIASIIIIMILMMEEVRTSETSVNFNVITRRYISEDSKRQFFFSFCLYTI
jgi:hypothetical protein